MNTFKLNYFFYFRQIKLVCGPKCLRFQTLLSATLIPIQVWRRKRSNTPVIVIDLGDPMAEVIFTFPMVASFPDTFTMA